MKERVAAADPFSASIREGATMFDFSSRLRESAHLLSLLSHYARLGSEDRAVWQDRLMRMEGVESKELSALHGELIAFGWVEQNTGHAHLRPDGTLAACYRVTQLGLREFRLIHGIECAEEPTGPTEKPQPRFPRKKKVQHESRAAPEPGEQVPADPAA